MVVHFLGAVVRSVPPFVGCGPAISRGWPEVVGRGSPHYSPFTEKKCRLPARPGGADGCRGGREIMSKRRRRAGDAPGPPSPRKSENGELAELVSRPLQFRGRHCFGGWCHVYQAAGCDPGPPTVDRVSGGAGAVSVLVPGPRRPVAAGGSDQAGAHRVSHGVRTIAEVQPLGHALDDVLDAPLGVAHLLRDLRGVVAVG